MAANVHAKFSNHSLENKIFMIWFKFHFSNFKFVPKGLTEYQLVLAQQVTAIIWTSDDYANKRVKSLKSIVVFYDSQIFHYKS